MRVALMVGGGSRGRERPGRLAYWGMESRANLRPHSTRRPSGVLGQETVHWGRWAKRGRAAVRCIGAGNGALGQGTARTFIASGQETEHWGRQIAYPNGWLPTPVRLICLR